MDKALEQNYERAGYHARQSWGKRPALILIDFAKAYFDPLRRCTAAQAVRALDNAVLLADAARASGVPVIFTEVKYQPGGGDGGAFYARCLRCLALTQVQRPRRSPRRLPSKRAI